MDRSLTILRDGCHVDGIGTGTRTGGKQSAETRFFSDRFFSHPRIVTWERALKMGSFDLGQPYSTLLSISFSFPRWLKEEAPCRIHEARGL